MDFRQTRQGAGIAAEARRGIRGRRSCAHRAWSAMFRAQNELAAPSAAKISSSRKKCATRCGLSSAEMTEAVQVRRSGSFADLIMRYRSPRVLAWAPSTDRKFGKILAQFMAANGRLMVADFRGGISSACATRWHAPERGEQLGQGDPGDAGLRGRYRDDPSTVAKVKRLKVPNRMASGRGETMRLQRMRRTGRVALFRLALRLRFARARREVTWCVWGGETYPITAYGIGGRKPARRSISDTPPLDVELSQIPAGKMTFLETQAGTVRSVALAGMMLRWVEAAGLGGRTPRATT